MHSNVEIAQKARLKPILEIAGAMGVDQSDLELYGWHKAKLSPKLWSKIQERPDGKLILVTSINPTPAGEGKTTVTVGLGQALNRLGRKAVIALREPSLGPVFGIKGGAAGGGYSQVVPMEDINLHFTGDIHAITAANNLLAAILDNHIFWGNSLRIDPRQILLKRVMDMNDRALRGIVAGLGGKAHGVPREESFQITVASEVMAILCLALDLTDLKGRLGRIIVAFDTGGNPVTASQLKAEGAMALLLKDAIKPNLVQTLENTPALVHGGPFANIAHGCNSLIATRYGLKLGDYLITEAGFGADLGAEKFLNIKCRFGNLCPSAAVVVVTIRALKFHGGIGKEELTKPNTAAIERGLPNLEKHLENLAIFGVPAVVAVNRFVNDTQEELTFLIEALRSRGVRVALADVWARGGAGGQELAQEVIGMVESNPSCFTPLYPLEMPIAAKIETVAREVYGADGVDFSREALRSIKRFTELGLDRLPVCLAKTQYSLSDDPLLLGRPAGFRVNVREVRASAGAGFIVALTGEIMTMPGLPRVPSAEGMDIGEDGGVTGLF